MKNNLILCVLVAERGYHYLEFLTEEDKQKKGAITFVESLNPNFKIVPYTDAK